MAQQLTITSIDLYQSKIKLKEPFIISLGRLTHAENVIVKITTEDGFFGFGECSPFLTINGESMETCMVVGAYLSKALKGMNALAIEDCHTSMNKVIYANNSIKSAFDMALYDIAAKFAGQPLYKFLGGDHKKILVTDYTVSFDQPEKMAADALKIKSKGFQVVKVKLGGDAKTDVERIRKIRAAIGLDLPVRIDANQGWNIQTAIEILKLLEPFNIQHCEEPIPRWDFMNLAEIRKTSPIKIMADETCCDEHDAQRLLELNACDYFNLKLGKSAGIFSALKIIQLAEANNINIQVGGFLESRLGFTAAAHVALSSHQIVYCDFDTPLMFEEDPVTNGITYNQKWEVQVPEINGLGAGFKEDYLVGLNKKNI